MWMLVDKFILNNKTRKRLSNILSDNMRLIEELGQRKYEEGERIGYEKGERNGYKRGSEIISRKIAENLLKEDLSLELISEVTNVPISQLKLFNNGK